MTGFNKLWMQAIDIIESGRIRTAKGLVYVSYPVEVGG